MTANNINILNFKSDCQHLLLERIQSKLLIVFLSIWIPDLENIIIIITARYVVVILPGQYNLCGQQGELRGSLPCHMTSS